MEPPDPPTGPTTRVIAAPTAADPSLPAGNGIQWRLAPIRYRGTVSLDGRWLRQDDGTTSTQALVHNDMEFASHVWQPWFIQLRAGLGALVGRDRTAGADGHVNNSQSTSLTGRIAIAVFPASRFPFQFRAETSDSRTQGNLLGTQYRSLRVGLSQAYRPARGNDSYGASYDFSRLQAQTGGEDTLHNLQATALRQLGDHTVDVSGSWSSNSRTDSDVRSRFTTVSARHGYRPTAGSFDVQTLASYNESATRTGDGAGAGAANDIRQLSSFATWRPKQGDLFYSPTSPLYVTGSVRFADAGVSGGEIDQRARTMNASLGANYELTRAVRMSGSVSLNQFDTGGLSSSSGSANGAVTYTPESLMWGDWRYSPNIGGNVGVSKGGPTGVRNSVGVQLGHSLGRGYTLGAGGSLSVNLSQSAGVSRQSSSSSPSSSSLSEEDNSLSRSLSHSAGLFWQGDAESSSQTYGGLSLSDTRTWSDVANSFQMVNLQLSRRTQLSRNSSWSGSLTMQATRSEQPTVELSSGLATASSGGWQRYYSGSLNYENARVFGVPRLRYTALLSLSSQQLERRELGDIDAPRERISESFENRLDYSIGRLEARLSAQTARIEGRQVSSIFARVLRRY